MPLLTKVIHTDDTGAGTVTVSPCFYAGSDGEAGTVNAEVGGNVGSGPLTSGTMKVVAGAIVVTAPPDSDCKLYFDFSL